MAVDNWRDVLEWLEAKHDRGALTEKEKAYMWELQDRLIHLANKCL